jgi:hypothetical protein
VEERVISGYPIPMKITQLSLTLSLLALPSLALAQTVRTGSGAAAANVQAIVDQYRADLGGALNPNTAGSFGSGRREINWDGVPATLSAPNSLPANFFNSNSPRGAVFSGAASFQVSGNTNDAGAGQPAIRFNNLNATYSTTFTTFSAQRLFTSVGTNVYDVSFFVPGSNTPALVKGFGSIFTDVDTLGGTTIQYFDQNNASLGTFSVPVQDLGLSFLGVSFNNPTIARVRITAGTVALGVNDNPGAGQDVVVADDFFYGEPVATSAPEPGTLAFILLGGTLTLIRRRRIAS